MPLKNISIRLFTGLICFIVLFSEARAQSAGERAAAYGLAAIQPLEIGDAIPEAIWQTEFTLVKHNEKPRTIKLADYRGKVIIFDFWATWCAGCILSMPKMHALAHANPKDVALLPVTHEDVGLITNFLKTTASPQIRELEQELETIVSGDLLKDLIPHKSIPHIAVINRDGLLELITMPHLLNDEVLQKIAAKEEYYIPTYRGTLDTTLLSHTFTDVKQVKPTYYSTLTGYLDGFANITNEWTDTVNNVQRGHFVNRPLLSLLGISLRANVGGVFRPNCRIMLMDDPAKIDFASGRNLNYSKKDFHCAYDYVLPGHFNIAQIRRRMRRDLEDLAGYYADTVRREVRQLVISVRSNNPPVTKYMKEQYRMVLDGMAQAKVPFEVGRSKQGSLNYMHGMKLGDLVYYLNHLKITTLPYVHENTGIDYKIDLELPDDLGDISALQEALAAQGLDLKLELAPMDMFVVSDKPIDREEVKRMPIKITKFGYVREGANHE